jgi:hypothetical protein
MIAFEILLGLNRNTGHTSALKAQFTQGRARRVPDFTIKNMPEEVGADSPRIGPRPLGWKAG